MLPGRTSSAGRAAVALAICVSAALAASLGTTARAQNAPAQTPPITRDLVVWCYDEDRDVVVRELAPQCRGSVISDTDAQRVRERREREILKAFSAPPPPREGHTEELGTGFFVDADGHLLTNNHVAGSCTQVEVETTDGSTYPATVLAIDVTNDLAILQTAIKPTEFARFRSQILDQAGASVSAIGYPDLGLPVREPVVTGGVVVSLAEGQARNHIAIKGNIRNGNSGSPIVDRYGLVVGIIRARLNVVNIYSKTGMLPPDIGIGVALPVAIDFLKKNQIHYLNGHEGEVLGAAELLAAARPYMARIVCWK